MSHRLYANLPSFSAHKTLALIHTDALASNYTMLSERIPRSVRRIAVVKADAYGHGAAACAKVLLAQGCDAFAVSCIEEAVALRRVCDQYAKSIPCADRALILILGETPPDLAPVLARYRLTQALLSARYAEHLAAKAQKSGITVHCHVALDTGMNRIGYPAQSESEIEETIQNLLSLRTVSALSVDGMFSHFADADGREECVLAAQSRTRLQFARYRAVLTALEAAGARPALCHVCNSAATLRFPEMHLDGVRLGILLYGVAPSAHLSVPLAPVMELCTHISHLHLLSPGEAVGYGGCFSASTPRTVATLPIGYADGFLRAYSGAAVTVHTKKGAFPAPIVGRVCMDQCMLDTTDIPADVGDTVTIFGDRSAHLQALSAHADTIPYESLCLISARVPRLYVK